MANLSSNLRVIWDGFVSDVSGYLPNLAAALLVLVLGWLAAVLLSKLVQAALRKTTIDNKIAGWVKGEGEPAPDIEPAIGRAVFWLVMIFVLVGFFQTLKLTAVTGPLNSFLNQIFEYAPRLLSAAMLLLVAWLVATGVRLVLRTALRGIRLDERVGSEVGSDDPDRASLSGMLSETLYWLVFLLFLPAVLDALALQGLLLPVRSMVEKLLGFLPNLFAAGLIFLIGWFVARVIQRIVRNLLAAVGADNVGERIGMDKVLGKQRLSGLIGLVVYTLILIPVLISALNALQLDAITRPASAMLDQILQALPALFGAALLLAIAYVIAKVVAGLVTNILRAAGFGTFLGRLGIAWNSDGGAGRASEMAGHLVVVAIMLFAAVEALGLLGFQQMAELVSAFIMFLGNVILALVIFGLGLYLAGLAATAIRASSSSQSAVLATAARAAILVLAGAMALRQMNVAEDIINLTFGMLLGAVAVAAAVAFGIGGRDLARKQLERWSGRMGSGNEG